MARASGLSISLKSGSGMLFGHVTIPKRIWDDRCCRFKRGLLETMRSCDETFTRLCVRHDQFLRNFGDHSEISENLRSFRIRLRSRKIGLLLFLHEFFSRYVCIVSWPVFCEAK
jgi:hypothetical protein